MRKHIVEILNVKENLINSLKKDNCIYELKESKRIIKERLGLDPIHLSYPHSMHSLLVQKAVAEAGYASATLGYGGSIRKGDDMYCLNRRFIVQE